MVSFAKVSDDLLNDIIRNKLNPLLLFAKFLSHMDTSLVTLEPSPVKFSHKLHI